MQVTKGQAWVVVRRACAWLGLGLALLAGVLEALERTAERLDPTTDSVANLLTESHPSIALNGAFPVELPAELMPPPGSGRVACSTWQRVRAGEEPQIWIGSRQPAAKGRLLRFHVAGDLGPGKAGLRVVVRTDADEVELRPDVAPGMRWKTVNVWRPSGEWWIEVIDEDETGWVSISEPVGMSRGEYVLGKAVRHRGLVALIAAGVLLIGVGEQLGRMTMRGLRRGGRVLARAGGTIGNGFGRGVRAAWRKRPGRPRRPLVFLAWLVMVVVLAAVAADHLGWIEPLAPSGRTGPGIGPEWLARSTRTYAWFGCTAAAIGGLLFVPGILVRRATAGRWLAETAHLPLPGLVVLVGLGWLAWLDADWGWVTARSWLGVVGWGALGEAWRAWRGECREERSGTSGEEWALAAYALVCAGVLAFAVLPAPVVQELYSRSPARARMVASPPDHVIPFRTAEYFHSGRDGREDSDAYFGKDWSLTSRGPLAPLAINGLFYLLDARPRSVAATSLRTWPAAVEGYQVARIFMVLANAWVLLAGAALARTLARREGEGDAAEAAGWRAMAWLAAAPFIAINLDFTWPKLMATASVVLALVAWVETRSAVRAGLLAGLAYLCHPVGALMTPAIVLFLAVEDWHRGEHFAQVGRQVARFVGGWMLMSLPWLVFKMHLGHPDAFWDYPLGDGRGTLLAEGWSSWMLCRWHNVWYSFVPGAFWASDLMQTWLFGTLSEPARWAVAYAKTLPAGVGHATFVVLVGILMRARRGERLMFGGCVLGGSMATMLVFWGYSADGLGRNCLEPFAVLALVLGAASTKMSRRGAMWVTAGGVFESLVVRWIGLNEGDANGFALMSGESRILWGLCVVLTVLGVVAIGDGWRRWGEPTGGR